MKRQQQEKEIQLVLNYSRKVYGSCNHSYMGCLADARLRRILGGGTYGAAEAIPLTNLMAMATDKQMTEAREYVDHWVPIAKEYMKPSSRIGRALAQFK